MAPKGIQQKRKQENKKRQQQVRHNFEETRVADDLDAPQASSADPDNRAKQTPIPPATRILISSFPLYERRISKINSFNNDILDKKWLKLEFVTCER